jgi:hypothetical protein
MKTAQPGLATAMMIPATAGPMMLAMEPDKLFSALACSSLSSETT